MVILNGINESAIGGLDDVQESKYPLGLEGALMHVYENECNYNKMMKAVGMKELQYYSECGGDYFVQEAGALGGFIEAAKNFLKKVLEKIKAMVKKFFAFINSKVASDKTFVKKYQKDLYRVNLTDFEFKGYRFKGDIFNKFRELSFKKIETLGAMAVKDNKVDTDAFSDIKDKARGEIIGEGPLDEKDFRYKLIEESGMDEKDTLEDEDINIRSLLQDISETKKAIKDVERSFKVIQKSINGYIKELDRLIKDNAPKRDETENESRRSSSIITYSNVRIDLCKSISNDYTVFEGVLIEFCKKVNAQAKAICVKALTYKPKNESAQIGGFDPFGSLEFE